MKEALKELTQIAEEYYDIYNSPCAYGDALNKACKLIAKNHNLDEEKLWNRYSGRSLNRFTASELIDKHKLRRIKFKMKLIEIKTPRSEWWIARSVPGHILTKKIERVIGKRVVVFPRIQFMFVRVPAYIYPENWIEKINGCLMLMQRLDKQLSMRELMQKRVRTIPQHLPVAGSWIKTEKKMEKKITKKELFMMLREEVIKRRVNRLISAFGLKYYFKRQQVTSSLYSAGKEVSKIEWVCPKGVIGCPCCKRKGCDTLRNLLEEDRTNVKEREVKEKVGRKSKRKRHKEKEKSSVRRVHIRRAFKEVSKDGGQNRKSSGNRGRRGRRGRRRKRKEIKGG